MWGPAARADYVDPLGSAGVHADPAQAAAQLISLRERACLHATRREFLYRYGTLAQKADAPTVGYMATEAHRSRPPRFGLTTALPRAAAEARDFARAVEAAGFDVLTFPDHLVPSASPFAGATAAALATERLHVGTLVLNNDFRHPVETAREAAGVATVTDGRFELGIGAGHMKSEYDAAGIPFDSGAVRVSRLEESVPLIRPLLDGERSGFRRRALPDACRGGDPGGPAARYGFQC